MTTRIARILIEFLNRHWPYLCREVVVPTGYHLHKDPTRQRVIFNIDGKEVYRGTVETVKSLAPVEIVTSDGRTEEQAGHDFGGQFVRVNP